MDVRTRWTIIGLGTFLSLAAIAALPPRPCDPSDHSIAKDAMCAYGGFGGSPHAAVADRMRNRLDQALRRRLLVDSVLASRSARQVTAGVISVFYAASLEADTARVWLALAQRELAMLPGGEGTGERVLVLLVRSDTADAARRVASAGGSLWWYHPPLDRFATTAHGGACVVVLDLSAGLAAHLIQQQRPNVLDWCALYGRFGAPGRGVERWASSAFSFGWRDNTSIAELAQGPAYPSFTPDDYRVQSCQTAAGAACLQYAEALGRSRDSYSSGRYNARFLLAWLVATGTHGQFPRFWKADGSLAEAMRAGYSRPADVMLQAWMLQRFAEHLPRASPLGRPQILLSGALWFSIAIGAAFVAMQRRQVG